MTLKTKLGELSFNRGKTSNRGRLQIEGGLQLGGGFQIEGGIKIKRGLELRGAAGRDLFFFKKKTKLGELSFNRGRISNRRRTSN